MSGVLACMGMQIHRDEGVALQAYELRGAGAVLHSHSLNAVLATLLDEAAPEFSVTHLEMIKVSTLLVHVLKASYTTRQIGLP